MTLFIGLPLSVLLAICVWSDIRKRLIYDAVTLSGIIYFVLFHVIVRDISLLETAGGCLGLGGLGLLLAVWSKGQFGGGDIKLLAMIGAAVGWSSGCWIFIFTFLLAGLFAWPVLLYRRLVRKNKEAGKEWPMAPFMAVGTLVLFWIAN